MEGPDPTPTPRKKGEPRTDRHRRCTVCGDLFAQNGMTNTSHGWMCRADYYWTATDNEDP